MALLDPPSFDIKTILLTASHSRAPSATTREIIQECEGKCVQLKLLSSYPKTTEVGPVRYILSFA